MDLRILLVGNDARLTGQLQQGLERCWGRWGKEGQMPDMVVARDFQEARTILADDYARIVAVVCFTFPTRDPGERLPVLFNHVHETYPRIRFFAVSSDPNPRPDEYVGFSEMPEEGEQTWELLNSWSREWSGLTWLHSVLFGGLPSPMG